ncbi:protein-methionine-sulfoxide reductase catalytic subunit MsrP [Iodidimonas nitroreducens]|uniref:Protein-methionine-sulfoxide reductase catalytic subunit MsrP n=2 Tax=Iodidimonas nitroreducens TaxID=1236968 RepID=A0A5A7NBA9_9PROT|nr:protein-methionine-sulfoxide reductase catalytic subunit MsrP [Iodidimonas nitroreducens]
MLIIQSGFSKAGSMVIRHRAPTDLRASDITPLALYRNRRAFLSMLGAGAILAGSLHAPKSHAQSPDQSARFDPYQQAPRNQGLSSSEELTAHEAVTSYNNFYEFGTDKGDPARYAGQMITAPWSVLVEGACERPGLYDLADLVPMSDLEERIYRLRCVEAWSMVIPWIGVPLHKILSPLGPTSKARYVQFETLADPKMMPGLAYPVLDWPYVEGLRIDEAMHPLTLMATGLYDAPLPNQNGAPLRLVVPWKYGFKSIKSIVAIRFVEKQPKTSWNQSAPSEYGFYSNVNPDVPHPRWSQATERRIGDFRRRDTLMFNGYADQVASLYTGMNLRRNF